MKKTKSVPLNFQRYGIQNSPILFFLIFLGCFLSWSSLWHRKIVKLRDGIVKLTSDVQINSISLMKYLFWIVRKDLFIQPLISV